MKLNVFRAILIILLFGTFFLIFGFSSQNAKESSSISKKISQDIVNVTRKNEDEQTKSKIVKQLEPVLRKIAHFSIYTVVGFLLMTLLFTYKIRFRIKFIISLILGFIYACSDEIHQTFVNGRSGEIRDVVLDTCGVCLGICISFACYQIYKKIKNRKTNTVN